MDQNEEVKFASCLSAPNDALRFVIGCDEAGRGPWAGPVAVAAACYVLDPATSFPTALTDSKALTDEQRRQILDYYLSIPSAAHTAFFESARMLDVPYVFLAGDAGDVRGLGGLLGASSIFVSAALIDQKNILEASLDGMTTAAATLIKALNKKHQKEMLHSGNTIIVIDGPHVPWDLLTDKARAEKEAKKLKAAEALAKKMKKEHARKFGAAPSADAGNETKQPGKRTSKTTKKSKQDEKMESTSAAGLEARFTSELVIDAASLIPPRFPISSELSDTVRGFPTAPFVKGDSRCPSIACASIFAKVMRDVYLESVLHVQYPQYRFDAHKGYGTALHATLLREYGPCPEHRKSYRPVAALLTGNSEATSPKRLREESEDES